jgi:hypothetical protein
MQPPVPMGEVLSDIAASLSRGGVSSSGTGGVGGWVFTVASVLALIAAGFAVRTARRLTRRSAPELIVLLNQSAAFYSRWPEDRLSSAPRAELVSEAARCRRIVELLESHPSVAADGGASRGAIDGLKMWIALLCKRIEQQANMPSGAAYA